TIERVFQVITWLIRWFILPLLLLPLIAGTSSGGWRGFTQAGRFRGRRFYWLEAPVLLLCAVWLPFALIGWVPHRGSFSLEIISFTARLLVAYFLFIGAWLLLAFLTSAGRPVLTHPRTAVSP